MQNQYASFFYIYLNSQHKVYNITILDILFDNFRNIYIHLLQGYPGILSLILFPTVLHNIILFTIKKSAALNT
jgi:hypothetical protein